MSLKKDLRKWKATFLAIDLILAALALAVLGYCGYLIFRINRMPEESWPAEISSRQEALTQLELQVQEQSQAVAQAEKTSLAALEQAQAAMDEIQTEYDAFSLEYEGLKAQAEEFENSTALQQQLREDIARIRTEYGQAVRKLEDMILAGESDYKICYLTLDDGPSYLTPDFLDLIDKLDIRVTFFTIGVQMLEADAKLREELLRREALGGHSIANHTYTHGIYSNLYDDLEIFMDSVKKQDDLVYRVAGFHPDIFRFPAGSYYCPFREAAIAELEKIGYGWIDWIGNAYDSGFPAKSSESVYNNVVWQVRQDKVTVVLMHDWRTETLGALRRIVETLQAENYLFLPLFKESSTVGTAKPRWG